MADRELRALVFETDLHDLAEKVKSALEEKEMFVSKENAEDGFPKLMKLYVDLAEEQRAFDIIDRLLTGQPLE